MFVDGFDYLVTPVAYDMQAEMVGVEGAPLGEEVYGAPVDGDAVKLGASTLFFAKRNGGIAATFDVVPTEPTTLGMLAVSWLPVGGSERIRKSNLVTWLGGALLGEADGPGVAKMDGLVHQYKAMSAASAACDGDMDLEVAAAQVDAAAHTLTAQAADLAQPDLDIEAALLRELSANLRLPGVDCAPADTWEY